MMKQKMVMCLLAGVLVLGIGGCGTQEVEVPEVENVETAGGRTCAGGDSGRRRRRTGED